MDRRDAPPLRSLPRAFVAGATMDGPFELPQSELDKLRKVLRLSSGAQVAVLPGDGRLIRCELDGRKAAPLDEHWPATEPRLQLTLAQALPKGDKLDEIVRGCTEAGASRFVVFPSERSVARWDAGKIEVRLGRLRVIAREAAEVSFRTRVPAVEWIDGLEPVLEGMPEAVVLSEAEGEQRLFARTSDEVMGVVVGPEGGWSPKELAVIGDRGATMGPRVLRVDHAGLAACAILLLARGE
ncbi:MAG: 16S rRNA (uracil(1498)-N(3))-methyltransferase [Fimbriimonas ginsengisoli]|uniref:Ribosomal RNA small subunit methyltransferase E n=1 Tax=Fimbriimonas ginsengisoli TaxID=1005039 RepID=A0A931LX76_FIMGI|nr:16S rRNA (uracil(1498)-N(3))-methyltransferase [Fimbriimonas ginsengisoli]